MLRHTAHPTESRYEILGLFTVSMIAASMLLVAVGTLLPYVSDAFSRDRSHVSLLVTAFFVGSTLLTAASGTATDRFGDKAVLIACGIVMGAALILSAAFYSFSWVVFCMFVYGVGYAAMNPVGSHAILFFFKPEERGLAMGVRQMGVPMGGVAGAILISTAAEYYGYRGAFLVTGILVLVVTLACAALYREPPQLYGQPVRAGVLVKDLLGMAREPRLLLITLTCMVLFTAQVALMAFFPWTLVHEIHVSSGFAALVFVVAQFAGAMGRLAWGWLSDRVFHGGRLLPLAITCVLCALGALAVSDVRGMPLAALAGVAVLLGAAAEGWFGLAIVAMAEVGGEQHAGSALGVGLTWVMATAIVTPTAFQSVMQNAGIPNAWHALALLCLAGVLPAAGAIALARVRPLSVKRAS